MVTDKRHAFYNSKAWRSFAYNLKVQRGGRCARCGEVVAEFRLLIGHHHPVALTEENVDDVAVALNPDNVEIVCHRCHNAEHRRFGYQQKVYLVWGSPLSGKSTFVRERMIAGDLVIDVDAIWQAVTGLPEYIKPAGCRFNVFAVRDALLDQVATRYGKWCDAYVIGGYADATERQRLADKLGAECIYIESTRAQCLERARSGGRPVEWVKYVDDWWDTFQRSGSS